MGSRVLIVGSGAREHALARAIAISGHEVIVAPGNAGTEKEFRNASVRADDVDGLVTLADREKVELVVVGPEAPLVAGLVDALGVCGIRAFGPSREAAALEGSKAFMKGFLARHHIPTAKHRVFSDADEAERYVREAGRPLVVKADGLAAGKGVVVAGDADEACDAIRRFMRRRELGDAGDVVIVEEVLTGEEASFHVVCDGTNAVPLVAAQDHKRVFDGDAGPNTGGMGAYAPAPVMTAEVQERAMRTIILPTLRGMSEEGFPFRGVLFAGLMIDHGVPRVLEFNVRFGDPETAVLVPLLAATHLSTGAPVDWFTLLDSAARGDLGAVKPGVASGSALCVVMAAAGYPAKPRTGDAISGVDEAAAEGGFVLHAGTKLEKGSLVTSGGRVLTVGAHAPALRTARDLAYAAVSRLRWEGEHHRSDIGHRALGG